MRPEMITACARTIAEVESSGLATNLPWVGMPDYATWTEGTLRRLSALLAGRQGFAPGPNGWEPSKVEANFDSIEERLVATYGDDAFKYYGVTSGRYGWPDAYS